MFAFSGHIFCWSNRESSIIKIDLPVIKGSNKIIKKVYDADGDILKAGITYYEDVNCIYVIDTHNQINLLKDEGNELVKVHTLFVSHDFYTEETTRFQT
jgi:hypothetical protein